MNGNLVCSIPLGILQSIDPASGAKLAVNGMVVAKDYESGETLSQQQDTVAVVFDVSPENLMVLEDASGDIRALGPFLARIKAIRISASTMRWKP